MLAWVSRRTGVGAACRVRRRARLKLPRPLLHSGDLNFSLRGLKTAVMTQYRKFGTHVCEQSRADLAASTQAAIVDVLVAKALRRAAKSGTRRSSWPAALVPTCACARSSTRVSTALAQRVH
jgi:N6-L-threonylcarbamoyladenine synthase